MAELTDTATLIETLDALDRPQTFLLDAFFPDIALFDTSQIVFDKLERATQLAAFVLPTAASTAGTTRGMETQSITPAYIKELGVVDPERPSQRRAGERIGGDDSNAARAARILTDLLEEQRSRIIRRKEWMAASVLLSGTVTIAGPSYPSKTVDFGRNASLTKALAGAARWGQAGVNPLDSLETWADEVATISGARPTTVVMGIGAWKAFRASADVRSLLDLRNAAQTAVQVGPTTRGQDNFATNHGMIGDFELWSYSQPYTDEAGVTRNFMPSGAVIMAAQGMQSGVAGYQAHGYIRSAHANYAASEIFPRHYIGENPPLEFVESASAPLVIPARPNASLAVTVL